MLLCIFIALFGKENKKGFIIFLIPLSIAESLLFYCTDKNASPEKKSNFMESSLDKDDDEEFVFICTGPSSKKYHIDNNCKWLGSCQGDIEEISLDDAEEMGREPCKACYNMIVEGDEDFDPDRDDPQTPESYGIKE